MPLSGEAKTAWSRDYYARNPERVKAIKRRWIAANPEKRAAQVALNNALRFGRVERGPCRDCGAAKAQAHHPDYSRPLEVVWLCPPCHRREHHPDEG